MSDSESDALPTPANIPGDEEIESVLRRVVRDGLKQDEDITTNIARTRAEEELGLHSGFFKDDAKWKDRSKDLIQAAVEDPTSPEVSKKKDVGKVKPKAGMKRKSDDAVEEKTKRRKKSPVVDSEKSEEEEAKKNAAQGSEGSEVEVAKALPKPKPQPKSEEESALSDPPDQESEPAAHKQNGKTSTNAVAEDDDSDLSSVIDDPPPKTKKSRQKKSSSPAATKSKSKTSKTTKPDKPTTSKPDLSPQEEQIKSLQSWLLKCGIRKLWHRELAAFPSPKAKISHLKSMLEEVGMTGRYSAEKAKQIKEQRELKAELEAAREFNEQWGQAKDEDGEEEGEGEGEEVKQPVRRLKPKGLVDFGDSGEESD